jgi:micrococcal nuclease
MAIRLFYRLAAMLLFAFPSLSIATELTGKVVGIQDGDTLTVWVDNGATTRIRLWGIDAPEKRQA